MSLSCFLRKASMNVFDNHGRSFLRAMVCPALYKNTSFQQKYNSNLSISKNVKHFSTSNALLAGHDHSKLWTVERGIACCMLAIVPAAFVMPSPPLDLALSFLTVLHIHWGVEAIVVDYVRESIFGSVIPKLGVGLVYIFSFSVLAGLVNLIFNDIGVVETLKLFWHV